MSHLERVEVRVCTVLGPDGQTDQTHTVHCPLQHESKLLVDCEVCDRCVEMRPEESFITCAVPAEKPETQVPFARRSVDRLTEGTTIGEVMARDVVCVTTELGLEALRALFLDRRISGVPVVDANGFPIGVVSKTDLLRQPPRATVREVMTLVAFTLEETQPLADAIKLMAIEQVHRVAVVDQSGRVIGMLSSLDVVRWLDG
jgi:CBS domain-containing protein